MTERSKISVPHFASFTQAWHTDTYEAISPSRPELSMAGKAVVVTGGGTGIGKAVAKAFAQAGASSVAILGRRQDRLSQAIREIAESISENPPILLHEAVDLTKREATEKALQRIAEKQGGKIDILVTNAGALVDPGPFISSTADEFMKGFDFNVLIPLNAIYAFLPYAGKDATLLNISSGVAHMKPIPGLSIHAASKAAGVKLMDYIQAENPNLHVVNVQPGSVDTEMSRQAGNPGKDSASLSGDFCLWLASREAVFLKSKFVWANWDVQEMIARADEIKSTKLLSIALHGVDM